MNFTQPEGKSFLIFFPGAIGKISYWNDVIAWKRQRSRELFKTHSANVLLTWFNWSLWYVMINKHSTWTHIPAIPDQIIFLLASDFLLDVTNSASLYRIHTVSDDNDVRVRLDWRFSPTRQKKDNKMFKSIAKKKPSSDTYTDQRLWASRPCCRMTWIPFEHGLSAARL